MELKFEDIVKEKAPNLTAVLIEADITNPDTPDSLWDRLKEISDRAHRNLTVDAINKQDAIAATRRAYKAFGKDPNRYRPSAEALTRRVVKGLDLYRTTAIVDLINLVSLQTGHSIGAFNADAIDGNVLTLGVGKEGEPYDAIGRGPLNIAGLPVWRDNIGGIGTPTSDNERTKITPATTRLAVIVNCYALTPLNPDDTARLIADGLTNHCNGRNISITHYKP